MPTSGHAMETDTAGPLRRLCAAVFVLFRRLFRGDGLWSDAHRDVAIGDGEDYDVYFPWLGIAQKGIEFPTRHKHDIAHRPGAENIDKINTEKWFHTKLARLLEKLAAVPEGTGTMLDNTVVLWMNSMNSGFGHTVLKLPIIVAAGANMGLRTGRLVNLTAEAHNKVLAAVANAAGVPMDGWGDPRFTGVTNLT